MAGIKELHTCKACNFDNPGGSKKCNRCGKNFKDYFGDWNGNFFKRWQCHLCGAKNQWSNETCHNCNFKSDHVPESCLIRIFKGIVAIIVVILCIMLFIMLAGI